MIFFGTLMAAGVVALGAPPTPRLEASASREAPTLHALNEALDFARPWIDTAFPRRGR
jgi:hypothetical protein